VKMRLEGTMAPRSIEMPSPCGHVILPLRMTPTLYAFIITSERYVVHRSNQGGTMDVKCSHDPGTASGMSCVCSDT